MHPQHLSPGPFADGNAVREKVGDLAAVPAGDTGIGDDAAQLKSRKLPPNQIAVKRLQLDIRQQVLGDFEVGEGRRHRA